MKNCHLSLPVSSPDLKGISSRSSAHVLSHQSCLLMLKDVAMKHEGVSAHCWPIEGDEELSFVLHEQGVFPGGKVCRRWLSLNG